MKKNISAIIIYAVTFLFIYIRYRQNVLLSNTFNAKHMYITLLLYIPVTIIIGAMLGIVAIEKPKTKRDKILNVIIIIIPSIIFLFPIQLIPFASIYNMIPAFIRFDSVLLTRVSGLLLGSEIISIIKKS